MTQNDEILIRFNLWRDSLEKSVGVLDEVLFK